MKRFVFIAIVASTVFFVTNSCTKDTSSNDPDPASSKYKLVKILYDDGGTENYYYNESNQIRKVSISDYYTEEFFYDSKGRLERVSRDYSDYLQTYHYQGEVLSYISFSSSSHIEECDTAFFSFDNSGRVSKKIQSYSSWSVQKRYETNYFYDVNNRLVKSIENSEDKSMQDTTILKWSSDGNLVSSLHSNNSWYEFWKTSYEYDKSLNYHNTIQYPASYLIYLNYVWFMDEKASKNNVKEIQGYQSNSPYNRFYNVTEQADGLPTRIVSGDFSMNLTYEKL